MEFSSMQMYWLLMLDNIVGLFVVLLCLSVIGFIMLLHVNDEPITAPLKNWLLIFLSAGIFSGIALTFIPTTKQMAAIIVVPKIINNERVQQLPDQILNLGIEWLEDLKPKKETK